MVGDCFYESRLQNSKTLFNLWGIVTAFQNILMYKKNIKLKLLITPQNLVSNCSYGKCLFAVSPLEFFWTEVLYHLFVFTVNGVFFTVQRAASRAKIGIVKVGRSRKSRSHSAALEAGHFCSKQRNTVFLRVRSSFYSRKFIFCEQRCCVMCHMLLLERVENTSQENSWMIKTGISYSCSLKCCLLAISDAIYIKVSYF